LYLRVRRALPSAPRWPAGSNRAPGHLAICLVGQDAARALRASDERRNGVDRLAGLPRRCGERYRRLLGSPRCRRQCELVADITIGAVEIRADINLCRAPALACVSSFRADEGGALLMPGG
jgi:hypothetical protein